MNNIKTQKEFTIWLRVIIIFKYIYLLLSYANVIGAGYIIYIEYPEMSWAPVLLMALANVSLWFYQIQRAKKQYMVEKYWFFNS